MDHDRCLHVHANDCVRSNLLRFFYRSFHCLNSGFLYLRRKSRDLSALERLKAAVNDPPTPLVLGARPVTIPKTFLILYPATVGVVTTMKLLLLKSITSIIILMVRTIKPLLCMHEAYVQKGLARAGNLKGSLKLSPSTMSLLLFVSSLSYVSRASISNTCLLY